MKGPTESEAPAPTESEAPGPTESEAPAPTESEAPGPTESEAPGPTESEAPGSPELSAAPPAVARAQKSSIERRIRLACIASLVALGLIAWSLVDPRPLPVIVAMSVGQAIGTLSLLLFVGSILLDLRARRILAKLSGKAGSADETERADKGPRPGGV